MQHPLDVVTFGEVMAMFVAEEAGTLDAVETYRRSLAGAEVNVAVALTRLGHRVGWLGRVGDDPFGTYAVRALAEHGIDVSAVSVDPWAPTGFQLKSRADAGADPEVRYFRRDSAGSRLASGPAVDAYLGSARYLHLTGIPAALSATARDLSFRAVEVARAAGAGVSFDPNLRPALWPDRTEMVRVVNDLACRADVVLPGLAEGEVLTGRTDPRGIAQFYLDRGVRTVVVKLGVPGAVAHEADECWEHEGFPVEVVDTVGAGDGFAAGFLSARLDGLDVREAVRRACAVGALATTARGDAEGMPTRSEHQRFLDGHTQAVVA
jgi:sugar/nucleoside kinase (ribokinase family)